jgi:hypothetical protein
MSNEQKFTLCEEFDINELCSHMSGETLSDDFIADICAENSYSFCCMDCESSDWCESVCEFIKNRREKEGE